MADDAGTIAAWAALAAALLALVVALAQAVQQYVATAQNMRKCEKSVWGPMPGHAGHRVWVWRQLRFRVVYDMPNIFIPAEYWETPGNARQFPTHRVTGLPVPFDRPEVTSETKRKTKRGAHLDVEKSPAPSAGAAPASADGTSTRSEACWVAFARQLSIVCPAAIRVGLMVGDVDRLPADLPVVPMQVSVRDVIALGLMAGMTLESYWGRSLEMSGPSGFVKSSDHPLLGHLLHFTAFSSSNLRSTFLRGDISRSWLRRLEGIASVANQPFDDEKRRYFEGIAMRWRDRHTWQFTIPMALPGRRRALIEGPNAAKEGGTPLVLSFIDMGGTEHWVPANKCETWEALLETLQSQKIAVLPFAIKGLDDSLVSPKSWEKLYSAMCKGDLKPTFKITQEEYVLPRPEGMVTKGKPSASNENDRAPNDTSRAGDKSKSETTDLSSIIEELLVRARNLERRSHKVESSRQKPWLAPTIESHNKEPNVACSKAAYTESLSSDSGSSEGSATDGGAAPGQSGNVPHHCYSHQHYQKPPGLYHRHRMSNGYVSESTRYVKPGPPVLSFFWASQIDVELGCWATPWAAGLFSECKKSLGMMVDLALAGLSHALRETGDGDGAGRAPPPLAGKVAYVEFPDGGVHGLDDLWRRLRAGEHTWPPHAINARGGVADPGPPGVLADFSAFGQGVKLPPLALLASVRDARRTTAGEHGRQNLARDRILELASIDLWLSRAVAAAEAAAATGYISNLLVDKAPALVEELWLCFGNAIMETRRKRWSRDGGDWSVRELAEKMDKELASARMASLRASERCIVWIAFMRAVKVMECIREGSNTVEALGTFKNESLVYLV